MNALIFSFFAAVCASAGNLFFRKNMGDTTSPVSANGYLSIYYGCSLLFSLIFFSDLWTTPFDLLLFSIGVCVGTLNVALMLLTARALNTGPAGLTFAFQNASAVFPGMILFLSFGSSFGFSFSIYQLIGIVFVLIGLFIGTKSNSDPHATYSSSWLKYALACFLVQILALTCIQGRCVLFNANQTGGMISSFAKSQEMDVWFMPGLFGAAFLLQLTLFLKEKRALQKRETLYGLMGGLSNLGSTALLLLATMSALPYEKALLFPCFAVGTILLSNLWANRLYQEEFNLTAHTLCTTGILIGILA